MGHGSTAGGWRRGVGLPPVDSLHLTLYPRGVSGTAMRREVETGDFEGYRPTREPGRFALSDPAESQAEAGAGGWGGAWDTNSCLHQ